MYRLVFVDDESIIREGISSCIAWEPLGFSLAALLENGQQAIEYLRTHPVDIVISDIKMPKIDGLELSRLIHEQYPQIMVLLLSGHDDFEYAQEALKYQVNEFLLKPITADELTEVLKRVRGQLDTQRQDLDLQAELQEKLEASFPLLRERFLYRMISGRLEASDIAQRKSYFQWEDLHGLYQIAVIRIPPSWDQLDRLSLAEHMKGYLLPADELLSNREENIVLILQDPVCGSEDPQTCRAYSTRVKQRGYEIARSVFSFISKRGEEQVSIGCGEVVTDLSHIVISYRGALSAVDYVQVLGTSRILHISEIRNRQTVSPERFNLLLCGLIDQLKTGSRDATRTALEEIFSYFELHYLTLHEASFYLIRMHARLQDFAQEMNLITEEDESIPYQTDYFVSINQAKGFFTRTITTIEDRIEAKRHDNTASRMDKARTIIDARFTEKDFSLQDICDELFLSTSQFSYLFKEATGSTFVDT